MSKPTWWHYWDLFLLIGLCAFLAPAIYLTPTSPLRIVAGTICIFYLPGYILVAALYPERGSINRGQRFAASVGLSVVICGLVNLATTYSVGTNLYTSFGALAFWIAAMVLIAGYRRHVTHPSVRFVPCLNIRSAVWREKGYLRKSVYLTQILAVMVLVLAAVRLLWIAHHTNPQFTEFYLLGSGGLAGNYPERAIVGNPVTVTIGVVHHGETSTGYDLFYRIDNGDYLPLTSIVLEDKERWESEVKIRPLETAKRQKVTFVLLKTGEEFPYRTLHIWLDVEHSGSDAAGHD